MYKFIHTLLLLGASLQAAPLLSVAQPNVAAPAGQSVQWQVTVTPDFSNFVTFTATFLLSETAPALGTYTDLLGAEGGPSDFVLPPATSDWLTSLGSYVIDPAALPDATNSVVLRVLWEEYSGDPNTCGGCFVSTGFVDQELSVQASAVPEPGTGVLFLLAGAGISTLRLLRRR